MREEGVGPGSGSGAGHRSVRGARAGVGEGQAAGREGEKAAVTAGA